jgi:MFS family permease
VAEVRAARDEGDPAGPVLREAVLRAPGVLPVLVTSFLARLSAGMYTVALLLLVQDRSGSYGAAGAAVAGYSLAGGLAAPFLGRWADRRGPVVVLAVTAPVHAAALLAVAVVPGLPVAAVVGLAMVGGLALPPVSPVVRALWAHRFRDDERALRAVFGVEAVFGEAVFVLGPLLVAGAGLLAGVDRAVVLAVVLTLGGTAALAASPLIRARRAGGEGDGVGETTGRTAASRWSALASAGLRVLVTAQLLLFAGFACVEIGVLATAGEWGDATAGGVLLAVWAGASVVGALVWGGRQAWPGVPAEQLPLLLCGAAAGTALVAALAAHRPGEPGWGTWLGAGAALALAGVFLAPSAIVAQTLLAQVTAPAQRTESFAWMSTAALMGSSAATAAVGLLVEAEGGAAALGAAVVAGLAAVAVVAAGQRSLAPPGGSAAATESQRQG